MKHYELEVEHYYKNKFVTRHRYSTNRGVVVLGQSRNADIRLLGDDVSEIHAYIECHNGEWSIIDAGSHHGTWVNKKPITNEVVKNDLSVTIGGHQIRLILHTFETEVFSDKALKRESNEGHIQYHQVIIRKNDLIMRTTMLDHNVAFKFFYDGKDHILSAPKVGEIKETTIGPYLLVQRIVKSDALKVTMRDFFATMKSPEIRTSMISVMAVLLLVSGLIVAIPQKPKEELTEIKPDNKYTRMIFDAELMKKKRAEAKEMRKTVMAKAKMQESPKNNMTTPVKSKGSTPKVVSQMKLEGLSALIGKIAKRANSKGPTIVGFGKTADNPNTGHSTTLASVGGLQGTATGMAGNGGQTFKVGGVGTFGKGGGNTRELAGVSGLAAGAAGSGTVGILDEETEIDGGLDKEVIAKVISNYLGEVRYCYERQLSSEPDIYGKVQIKFTIDANGTVADQRIGTTTLKSAMVEGCILRRLARWKFPKPKGGTHVLVTYPFMFKSTN